MEQAPLVLCSFITAITFVPNPALYPEPPLMPAAAAALGAVGLTQVRTRSLLALHTIKLVARRLVSSISSRALDLAGVRQMCRKPSAIASSH